MTGTPETVADILTFCKGARRNWDSHPRDSYERGYGAACNSLGERLEAALAVAPRMAGAEDKWRQELYAVAEAIGYPRESVDLPDCDHVLAGAVRSLVGRIEGLEAEATRNLLSGTTKGFQAGQKSALDALETLSKQHVEAHLAGMRQSNVLPPEAAAYERGVADGHLCVTGDLDALIASLKGT